MGLLEAVGYLIFPLAVAEVAANPVHRQAVVAEAEGSVLLEEAAAVANSQVEVVMSLPLEVAGACQKVEEVVVVKLF